MTTRICKECGQTFLSWEEFDVHVNRHLQKHLDEYTPKVPEVNTTRGQATGQCYVYGAMVI